MTDKNTGGETGARSGGMGPGAAGALIGAAVVAAVMGWFVLTSAPETPESGAPAAAETGAQAPATGASPQEAAGGAAATPEAQTSAASTPATAAPNAAPNAAPDAAPNAGPDAEGGDLPATAADASASGTQDPAAGGAANPATAATASTATDAPAADAAATAGSAAEAGSSSDAGTPAGAAAVAPLGVPKFDTLRAGADGSVLVAGQADAGVAISVVVDGAETAQAETNARGQFAALFTLPLSDQPRIVALTAKRGTEVRQSAETMIIAPRSAEEIAAAQASAPVAQPSGAEAPAPQDMAAATGAGAAAPTAEGAATSPAAALGAGAGAGAGTAAGTGTSTDTGTGAATVAGASAAAAAPSVLVSNADGVRVLAPAAAELVIDAISYDSGTDVTVTGRGAGEAGQPGFVRAYLNNADVGLGQVAADGSWSLALKDVAPGTYTLRIDAVSAGGRVTGRAETPFRRETPEVLAAAQPAAPAPGQVAAKVVTVQPGFTLWGIARDTYGDGFLYVRVFDANKGQIRNPDLIYPGQVFALPQ